MANPPTTQYQQLNQRTMQDIQNILCIGCTDVGAITMLVMASHWPEKQFVVADDNTRKIQAWQNDDLPSFEPGLQILLAKRRNANLRFTSTNIVGEINDASIIFVAVDVQTKRNGERMRGCLDFTRWKDTMKMIVDNATQAKFIVEMSSFPLEDHELLLDHFISHNLSNDALTSSHHVFSIPNFSSPGTMIADIETPTQVIIASRIIDANVSLITQLYARWVPQNRIHGNISPQTAEIGRIACNVIQAMNIASMNYVTLLCEEYGADITDIERIIAQDRRIDRTQIRRNAGISGPGLQRDVQYSAYLAGTRGHEYHSKLFKNTIEMNKRHKEIIVKIMIQSLVSLRGISIAVMGFSCKGNTSNIQDSPALYICERLLGEGATLKIYDPRVSRAVIESCFRTGVRGRIQIIPRDGINNIGDESTTAILFLQRWGEFNGINFEHVYRRMRKPAFIFEACNCNLNYHDLRDTGFVVRLIGRRRDRIDN